MREKSPAVCRVVMVVVMVLDIVGGDDGAASFEHLRRGQSKTVKQTNRSKRNKANPKAVTPN